jgi:hypothetical protein
VPASYGRDVAPEDLPHGELVPTGAEVDDAVEVDDDAVALTWVLGDDPFRSEHGLAVWRRSPGGSPPWRATFAIREPPRAGVLGILMTWTVQDLTGDGLADILFLESLGGSGTCGTWGVVQLTPGRDDQTFRRQLCDGTVDPLLRRPGLSIQESFFGPDDPHCCPSGQRTSTLEWNGARWRVTSVEEVAT